MTEEQRKQLYEVLDYDEKSALLAESFQAPRDALKARVVATLNRGSFALKTDPHGANKEIISIVSESLNSTFIQRPDNFEVTLSLGGFEIRDGTTSNTLYPKIVHVQESKSGPTSPTREGKGIEGTKDTEDPFFFLIAYVVSRRHYARLTIRYRSSQRHHTAIQAHCCPAR